MKPGLCIFALSFFSAYCSLFNDARAETIGVTAQEIVLGSTTNLTGVNPSRAIGASDGAKLYFNRINKAGGILGRKIRLIEYDDRYEPKLAAANAEKLIGEDKVFAIFQPYGTASAKALIAIADRSNVPVLFPFSGATFLSDPPLKNVFTLRARYHEEGVAMVDFAVSKGWRDIGIISQNDSGGVDQKSGVMKQLAALNLKSVAEVTVENGSSDYEPSIEQLMKKKPNAVALGILGQSSADIINQIYVKGFKPAILCFSPCLTETFPKDIKNQAEGIYLFQSTPLISETGIPVVKEYLKDCENAAIKPSNTGLEGYLDAKIMVAALEKSGQTPTREILRSTLETQFEDFDLGGFKVSFSPTHHQGSSQIPVRKANGAQFQIQ